MIGNVKNDEDVEDAAGLLGEGGLLVAALDSILVGLLAVVVDLVDVV